MEPLSELLALLKPQTSFSVGLDAGGAWALRFPAQEGIKFTALTHGGCWLKVEGDAESYKLEEGDCFLLTSQKPFVLAADLSLQAKAADSLYADGCDRIAIYNNGGDCFLVGARFLFTGEYAKGLLENLPSVVVVGKSLDQASVLRWSLAQFENEIREQRPGGSLIAGHLAHIMLIQVLRVYLTSSDTKGMGLLFAHADPQLSAAMAAMHADASRSWRLEELSKAAGMSRSSFASRFKQVACVSPMEYLAFWRIHIAAERLRSGTHGVGWIANSVGYRSEAAFSRAFKKVFGQSPTHYRSRPHEAHLQGLRQPLQVANRDAIYDVV